MPRSTLAAATVAALALAGCATVSRPAAPAGVTASAGVLPQAEAASPLGGAEGDGPAEPGRAAGAAPRGPGGEDAPAPGGAERGVARARALLGLRGPFRVGRERFRDDCSGFVAAVYAASGLDLRAVMQRMGERRGALAAWRAAEERGGTFGEEAAPAAGDLVFWHDTYDRNRNRRADDRFTHVGIVERVEDGTVVFLHRGGKGVARGVMTLARRHEARAADGTLLNSAVQARARRARRGGGLAGALFAGFARLDALPPTAAGAEASLQARTPPRGASRARRVR